MKGCDPFIDQICQTWGLPRLGDGEDVPDKLREFVFDPEIPACVPANMDEPPQLPEHDLDQWWESSSTRIWIQVDCKGLADLLAGRASLEAEDLRPIFVRIAQHFETTPSRISTSAQRLGLYSVVTEAIQHSC